MNQPSGCLFGFIANLFGRSGGAASTGDEESLPRVIVNKRFVSEAEANFFRVLKSVVGQRGHVLAQVSLKQLLWFPPNQKDRSALQRWRNKVAQKSLDFVICDAATLKPLVVLELDDSSHATPERQTRDEEVGAILHAAGLPLVHVLPDWTYNTRELEAAIWPYLSAK